MPTLDTVLEANRAAVDDLIATGERIPHEAWTVPRAPGKWSPSQIVEHVARSHEEGGNVVQERPSELPSLPFFVRPLARMMFNRILKTGRFPKSKATKGMSPIEGPATVEEGSARLRAALEVFERDCRERKNAGGVLKSPAFGTLTVEDYARFVELHTRHHTKQMPVIL